MGKLKLILALVVAIGLLAVCQWQHSSIGELRRENESLRATLAELKQQQEVREPAPTDDAQAKEQLAELLKLRGEVTLLRGQTNEIAGLAEANEKLTASIQELEHSEKKSSVKKTPPNALPQDIHPKATWGYRGYGSPDATVESVLTAMLSGDKATFIAGFAPDMQARMEKDFNGKDISEEIKKEDQAEFRVIDRQVVSDDEVVLNMYVSHKNPNGDDEGSTEKTTFVRIDGQWKITEKPPSNNSQ